MAAQIQITVENGKINLIVPEGVNGRQVRSWKRRNQHKIDAINASIKTEKPGDGFTLSKTGKPANLKTGYMVSFPHFEKICPLPDKQCMVRGVDFLMGNLSYLPDSYYLGGWEDGGFLYLDISVRIPTLRDALIRARELGQKSIYDNRNGVCIDVEQKKVSSKMRKSIEKLEMEYGTLQKKFGSEEPHNEYNPAFYCYCDLSSRILKGFTRTVLHNGEIHRV